MSVSLIFSARAAKPAREPREARPPREAREPREPRERVVEDAEVVSRSIYVAGLTWSTTEDELRAHCKKAGNIVKVTILQRRRGRELVSRGCGVVEFKTVADAQRAINTLANTELNGRPISVREDRGDVAKENAAAAASAAAAAPAAAPASAPAAEAKGSRRREREPRKKIDDSEKTLEPKMVFVSNLSWDTSREVLSNLAAPFGDLRSCQILTTKAGRSVGHAILEYAKESQAKEAINQINGKELDGRQLIAKEYYSIDKK